MNFKGEPQTFMSKAMAAVMAPMLKGTMVKCITKDLQDLKANLEAAPAE
jgi:hypothetical protein